MTYLNLWLFAGLLGSLPILWQFYHDNMDEIPEEWPVILVAGILFGGLTALLGAVMLFGMVFKMFDPPYRK